MKQKTSTLTNLLKFFEGITAIIDKENSNLIRFSEDSVFLYHRLLDKRCRTKAKSLCRIKLSPKEKNKRERCRVIIKEEKKLLLMEGLVEVYALNILKMLRYD